MPDGPLHRGADAAVDRPASSRGGRRSGGELLKIERVTVPLARRAIHSKELDPIFRWLVRNIGARGVDLLVSRRLRVLGLSRLPAFEEGRSYILASNHRSYFDMFVICAYLIRRCGLRQRVTFPVRSEFFYDHPVGFVLNGAFTFFTMYPPIWRERRRMALTVTSIKEMTALLAPGDWVIGMHPEGTRNTEPDPYTLLRAYSGVGRVAVEARVPVIPVFIHGLGNDFAGEVGALLRDERPVFLSFGAPVQPLEPGAGSREKVYTAMTERVMSAIKSLGEEERAARADAGAAGAGARP